MEVALETMAPPQLINEYLHFWTLLDNRWKYDEILLTILLSIILFNPDQLDSQEAKQFVRYVNVEEGKELIQRMEEPAIERTQHLESKGLNGKNV